MVKKKKIHYIKVTYILSALKSSNTVVKLNNDFYG